MDITYRTNDHILHLEPTGRISDDDFTALAARLETLEREGEALRGLVIRTETLPGFEQLSHLFAPNHFLQDHADTLARVALCTHSKVGDLTQLLEKRFRDAPVETFGYDEVDAAETWIQRGVEPASPNRALGTRYAISE